MNYYNEIKEKLIKSEIYDRAKDYSKDRHKVIVYFEIGKLLSEAGKEYGKNIIKQYSENLMIEVGKKYNERNLRYMRQFYEIFSSIKWNPVGSKLSWSHITELMVLSDEYEINYYISLVNERNISYRKLSELIKDNEYARIDEHTKNKLKQKEKLDVKDFIKSPIVIRNNNNYEIISEKILQKLILEDIESFMKKLGNSFCFIGSEYKIRLGTNFNYIDLLLFNIEYNCYVVVELKVTELKKEHIGQIQVYMNYIDENLKKFNQDKTIGIIICKQDKQSLPKRNHLLKQQICFV